MAVLVKDIMSHPRTIDINKNIKSAGELMTKYRINTLIVVKNRHPVGLITDSDLIKKVIAKNIKPSSLKIRGVMSRPLVSVEPRQTAIEAVRKMKKSNIKRLIVLDKGKLVGIITLSDIARNSPEMKELLDYKLKMKEFTPAIRERFTSGLCDYCGNYTDDLKNANGRWLCEMCMEELKE